MAVSRTTNGELAKQDGNEQVDPTVYGNNFDVLSSLYEYGNALAVGTGLAPRHHVTTSVSQASGEIDFIYFTAHRGSISGGTISKVEMFIGDVAAAGLTTARIGLYTVDSTNSNLTLVASTANSTTGWDNQYGSVVKDLSSPYSLEVGRRYAFGVLFVGTTPPKLTGVNGSSDWSLNARPPRLFGKLTSQASLPSTVADSALATIPSGPYAILSA